MQSPAEITQLLKACSEGQADVFDQLVSIFYEQLKRIAHNRLREERSGHTLNTTGLVHEAYLKLIDINQVQYESRGHFFAMAARVMRRILIDYAERRKALKRGGGARNETLDEGLLMPDAYAESLLDLDDALKRLEKAHPRPSQAVAHRYFGGLTNEETAEALGVSLTTVERDLRFARAWLSVEWNSTPGLT